MVMTSVTMEQMHERASEDEDERRVDENVLPVPDECAHHDNREDVIEPMRNAEVFHG